MGETVPFPAKPASTAIDLNALSLERASHVLAIRAIDDASIAEVERRAAAFEEACQAVVSTAISLPTLPDGVREECRQIAADLPSRLQRITRLMRPLASQAQPEPSGAA